MCGGCAKRLKVEARDVSVTCERCTITFKSARLTRRYCDDCGPKVKAENARRHHEKYGRVHYVERRRKSGHHAPGDVVAVVCPKCSEQFDWTFDGRRNPRCADCLKPPEFRCIDCGVELPWTGRGAHPKRCSECRRLVQNRKTAAGHRIRRAADPEKYRAQARAQEARSARCIAPDCERPGVYADGYCSTHKTQLRRFGEIRPKQKYTVRNNITPDGYRTVRVDGKVAREHRVVMEEYLGRPLEPSENIHHKNGIRHDNRVENLEVWLTSQPAGQRPDDLADFLVQFHPDAIRRALEKHTAAVLVAAA